MNYWLFLNKVIFILFFWWFEWSWHKVLVGEPVGGLYLRVSDIFNSLDFFNYYVNDSFEDVLVVFFLYSFFKYLVTCSIVELIWPTQFFNRRNNIGYSYLRFRTFTEVVLKLRNYSSLFFVFNLSYLNFLFFSVK